MDNRMPLGSFLIISFGREKCYFQVVFNVVFYQYIPVQTSSYWHVPNWSLLQDYWAISASLLSANLSTTHKLEGWKAWVGLEVRVRVGDSNHQAMPPPSLISLLPLSKVELKICEDCKSFADEYWWTISQGHCTHDMCVYEICSLWIFALCSANLELWEQAYPILKKFAMYMWTNVSSTTRHI